MDNLITTDIPVADALIMRANIEKSMIYANMVCVLMAIVLDVPPTNVLLMMCSYKH